MLRSFLGSPSPCTLNTAQSQQYLNQGLGFVGCIYTTKLNNSGCGSTGTQPPILINIQRVSWQGVGPVQPGATDSSWAQPRAWRGGHRPFPKGNADASGSFWQLESLAAWALLHCVRWPRGQGMGPSTVCIAKIVQLLRLVVDPACALMLCSVRVRHNLPKAITRRYTFHRGFPQSGHSLLTNAVV